MSQFERAYDFRLLFHSNYGPVLYRLPHTHGLKIAKFIYPVPHRNFAKMFSTGKTGMIQLPYAEESMLIR